MPMITAVLVLEEDEVEPSGAVLLLLVIVVGCCVLSEDTVCSVGLCCEAVCELGGDEDGWEVVVVAVVSVLGEGALAVSARVDDDDAGGDDDAEGSTWHSLDASYSTQCMV
jgi:hypothetical protein